MEIFTLLETLEDILEEAKNMGENPFIIILDGIEDPHNLGAIIRTAETAGAHGIIIPKRRAASVNSTVNKVSAGAVEYMKIARVTNISDAINELKLRLSPKECKRKKKKKKRKKKRKKSRKYWMKKRRKEKKILMAQLQL